MTTYNTSFPIKSWNEDDRPREKLILKGRSAVTNAELIAILIGSGNRDESAVMLSQRILAAASNNIHRLAKFSIKELCEFKGIGEAKAIAIISALELGKRRKSQDVLERNKITSSVSVFELMQARIGDLPHEEFWIIYLNNSNKVLLTELLSKGGITGTLVDVRLVLKRAIELGAVGIILAHNHPSGTLKPSESDIKLTAKIKKAGDSLDINILDHLIITEKAYFSFADEQML